MKIKRASDKTSDAQAKPDSKQGVAHLAPKLDSHSALDKLFKKTQSKPHIYYKFFTLEEATLGKRQPVAAALPQP